MPLLGPILSFGSFSAAILALVAAVVIGAFWVGWGLLLAPDEGNKDAARAPMERGVKGGAFAETPSVPTAKEEEQDAGTGMAAPSRGVAREDEKGGAVAVDRCASAAMDGERNKVHEFVEQVGGVALVDGNEWVPPGLVPPKEDTEEEDGCAEIAPVHAAKEKTDGLMESEPVPPPANSVEVKDPVAAELCAVSPLVERETKVNVQLVEEVRAALVAGQERAPADMAPSVAETHEEEEDGEEGAFVGIPTASNANEKEDALTEIPPPPMPREEDKDALVVGLCAAPEVEEEKKTHHLVVELVHVSVVATEERDVPVEEANLAVENVSKEDRPIKSKAPDRLEIGELTLEELKAYDGSAAERPLLLAIKGNIYDVSTSRQLYGPGGHYELFGGRDVTRALALMSFEPEDLTGKIDDLKKTDLEVLGDWEQKFMEKYPSVGCLIAVSSDDAKQHP